jgi:hypothetical protein
MARVPVINLPCPLRWKTLPTTGSDFCGQCERRVHNLDAMNEAERRSFFSTCSGEVCVAYTIPRRTGMAAFGAVAALVGAAQATAQDTYPTQVTGPTCDPLQETIVVGGVKSARDVRWVDEREAARPAAPEIQEIAASDWLPGPNESKIDSRGD